MSANATALGSGNTATIPTQVKGTPICYEVPFLEDTDSFAHWEICITMVLEENDLMSIVDGSLTKPDQTADPVGHVEWMSKDWWAHMHIATTVCKGALDLILKKKSAKECWDKLIARYQGKGGRHVVFLMESFFQTPLTDAELMEPQLNKLVKAN